MVVVRLMFFCVFVFNAGLVCVAALLVYFALQYVLFSCLCVCCVCCVVHVVCLWCVFA